MNKFQNLISNNSNATLVRRAGTLATQAEIAQQNIVNKLKQEISKLETTIITLTDFAPESTDSLRPGSKDWDPEQWAADLQRAKCQLYTKKIELEQAVETYNEFFTEEE